MRPAPPAEVPETTFVEGSGKAFNTVPPSDFGFFELMNEVVQEEPAGSTGAELLGQLAAIGIVKGEPFEPDERMRRVLEDAAAVGAATSRALFFDSRASEEFAYYDDSAWFNMLWVGGYTFETPPPLVTKEGIKPFPATGVRKLHSRTSFLYAATGVTPAMCMRLTGIGSQYLMATKDADGRPARWREDLPGDAATGHPGSPLLVGHRLRQRDTLDARRRRSASRAPAASPTRHRRRAANDDGSTTITSGRNDPTDSPEGNWIQTDRRQGLVPDPAPLQPARSRSSTSPGGRARSSPWPRNGPNERKHHGRVRQTGPRSSTY